MIHYHGTPLSPRARLYDMAGKNLCVSFADRRDGDLALQIAQSVLWDNGAFSLYTRDQAVDWKSYHAWIEPRLGHPHWAVIPDVIDGSEADNWTLIEAWPHRRDCAAPVWHLSESIGQLHRMLDAGFWRVCFGSSGAYWEVGSAAWCRRVDEAFDSIVMRGSLPWIHMLRGLSLAGDRWPFASADSVNVARNFKDQNTCPERMARRIDAVQCPVGWEARARQLELIA